MREAPVYVCICNNVTERDIAEAVRAGARSLECLAHELAVSTCCGQCREVAQDCLMAALETSHAGLPALNPAQLRLECA